MQHVQLGERLFFGIFLGENRLYLVDISLYAVKVTAEKHLSVMDKRHRVADLVYLLQIVGRDNGSKLSVQHSVHQHSLDDNAHSRVKSVEGFVQKQIIRTAGKSDYNYRLTLHTL